MSSVNAVDYIVIVLYALLMVLVGLYVVRFNRSAAEYFRGGSRVPWLVAGLSCFMSGFSAWTFTGAAGVAYRAGSYRFLETNDEYFDYAPAKIPPQGRWRIYGIDLPDNILRKVYYENAARLLRI
jgi:hypothetical protein